jgi:Tfp pilus assembly protein PilF
MEGWYMDFELYKHIVASQYYADHGKLKDAIKEIQYCISQDNKNAECHKLLGSLYGMSNRNKEALLEFQEALNLDPTIDVHISLGAAYLNIGQIDLALPELLIAIENDPNNYKVHNLLGVCYYRQSKLDDASRELLMALKINPNTPDVNGLLAKIYKEKEKMVQKNSGK